MILEGLGYVGEAGWGRKGGSWDEWGSLLCNQAALYKKSFASDVWQFAEQHFVFYYYDHL